MALLKLTGSITHIAGRLGGDVFCKTANGQVLKHNSYSQQRGTPLQLARRNFIYRSTQLWRDLSSSDKEDWANATIDFPYINKIGDTAYYTGYQLHNLINANLLLVRKPTRTTPPTAATLPTKTLSWDTLTSSSIILFYTGSQAMSGRVIYMTPPIDANIVDPTKYLKVFAIASSSASGGGVIVTSPYIARFGVPPVGSAVWFTMKFVQNNTGITDGIYPPIKGIVV